MKIACLRRLVVRRTFSTIAKPSIDISNKSAKTPSLEVENVVPSTLVTVSNTVTDKAMENGGKLDGVILSALPTGVNKSSFNVLAITDDGSLFRPHLLTLFEGVPREQAKLMSRWTFNIAKTVDSSRATKLPHSNDDVHCTSFAATTPSTATVSDVLAMAEKACTYTMSPRGQSLITKLLAGPNAWAGDDVPSGLIVPLPKGAQLMRNAKSPNKLRSELEVPLANGELGKLSIAVSGRGIYQKHFQYMNSAENVRDFRKRARTSLPVAAEYGVILLGAPWIPEMWEYDPTVVARCYPMLVALITKDEVLSSF